MRLAGPESWQVNMDIPYPIEFLAYVGQQEGFSLEGDDSTTAEGEWRQWFEDLLKIDRSPWQRPPIDPPEFPLLADKPLLKELCLRHLWGFDHHWQLTKFQLIKQLQAQTNALYLQGIVNNCELKVKRRAGPFKLSVVFVQWPEDCKRIVSENLIVLGKSYLDTSRLQDLQTVLESQIALLI